MARAGRREQDALSPRGSAVLSLSVDFVVSVSLGDDLVSLVLKMPGRVTINGTATLNAGVDSGCFAMSDKVTVKNG